MAGLTKNGPVIKRLSQVIQDRISSARNFFGDNAKTTVNDALGRALRVGASSEADLWELFETQYYSHHPDYAQGAALDRIVGYGRLTRFPARPSTVSVLVVGDYQSSVPSDSYVTSSVTSNRFIIPSTVDFNSSSVTGFIVEPISAVDGEEYRITIGSSVKSYTATSGDTTEDIAASLIAEFDDSTAFTSKSVEDKPTWVEVNSNEVFVTRDLEVSSNISIKKTKKITVAESEEDGEISQPAGTLDTIGTPSTGWDSVTNPEDAVLGRLRETDQELRVRFKNSKENNARGTIDAMYSSLNNVQGVRNVQIYENEEDGVDSNGLPEHSFSAIILEGSTSSIAQTIWENKPAGIKSYGNTTYTVDDSQGIPHDINFSRPIDVPVYINVEASPIDGRQVPSDLDVQIIDQLEEYFDDTYSVGDDVIYSRLYLPIQKSLSDFQIDSLTIGTSSDPSSMANITVGYDEIAAFNRENVNVVVNT